MSDPMNADPLGSLANPTRRHFLRRSGLGLGSMALGSLAGQDSIAKAARALGDDPLAPKMPPAFARAKQVIFLHMAGSPPHLDLFDYKPELQARDGQPCPQSFLDGRRLAFTKGHPDLLASPYRFAQHGETGQWVSEHLPHFTTIVDRVAMVRSMHTTEFNHAPADLFLFTGSNQFGGASMGSWMSYGLGTLNQNLPAFVVLVSGESDPTGGKSVWGSGFLPSVHQGVRCRSQGDPVLYVSDPQGMDRGSRRRSLDALKRLNEIDHERVGDPEILARIEQYELAYRMQSAVPEVMDIGCEPESIREMYGARPGEASFANNCLLARRLVENGVRFVQLHDWGWDLHGTSNGDDLITQFPRKCRETDRPIAALIHDLERRGLLDETLVVWSGEFGRGAMREARNGSTLLGRDHHPDCFTSWLCGGGVQAGARLGETDDFGYTITQDPVGVHDLQATILHLCGFDPETFRYPYQGLEQRLIGPAAGPRVVHEILAS